MAPSLLSNLIFLVWVLTLLNLMLIEFFYLKEVKSYINTNVIPSSNTLNSFLYNIRNISKIKINSSSKLKQSTNKNIKEKFSTFEHLRKLFEDKSEILGSIDSLNQDGSARVLVNIQNNVSNDYIKAILPPSTQLNLHLLNSFRGRQLNFIIKEIKLPQNNKILLHLHPPYELLNLQNITSLLKHITTQDVKTINHLNLEKSYPITILRFQEPYAFCLISNTKLIGLIRLNSISSGLFEGSLTYANVANIQPLDKTFLSDPITSKELKQIDQEFHLRKAIILTIEASKEMQKLQHLEKSSLPFLVGLQTESKFFRDNKDEIIEDEILNALGSKKYKKWYNERTQVLRGGNRNMEDELFFFQEEFINLEEYINDEEKRKSLTNEFLTRYLDRMSKYLKFLLGLNLKELKEKILYYKMHQDLLYHNSQTNANELSITGSPNSKITSTSLEQLTWIDPEIRKRLATIFVNSIDPIKIIDNLIEKKNSYNSELKQNNPITKSKHDNFFPTLKFENKSNKQTSQKNLENMNPDDIRLTRVRKYDSWLRRGLQIRKEPSINLELSDYIHYPNNSFSFYNTNKNALQSLNNIYIPLLEN